MLIAKHYLCSCSLCLFIVGVFTKGVRYFGVPLSELKKDQLTLAGVPTLVDRALRFLHVAFIDGKISFLVMGFLSSIPANYNTWSTHQVAAWIDEIGVPGARRAFSAAKISLLYTTKCGNASRGKELETLSETLLPQIVDEQYVPAVAQKIKKLVKGPGICYLRFLPNYKNLQSLADT